MFGKLTESFKQFFTKAKENLKKINRQKLGLNLILLTGILFMVVFLMNLGNNLPSWLNNKLFFVLFIASGVFYFVQVIKNIPETKRDKSSVVYYFSHLFLLLLVVIAVNQFLKNSFITNNVFYISVVAIGFGFLTFYSNKNKVEKDIENEKITEEEKEKKRKQEFPDKFPRLNKIPVLRRFVRWMYKEGWIYSGGLLGVIIISSIIKLWIINLSSLKGDEGLLIYLIEGVQKFGFPILDTGKIYIRGFIHTYLSSIFSFLTTNEAIYLRLPSLLFSVGVCFLLYNIFKKLKFKSLISIIIVFLFAFNPYFFFWSIEGRFYMESLFWVLLFFFEYFLNKKINNYTIFLIPFLCFQSSFFGIFIYGIMFFEEVKKAILKRKGRILIKVVLSILFILIFWQVNNYLDSAFMKGDVNISGEYKSLDIGLDLNPAKIEYFKAISITIFPPIILILSFSFFLLETINILNKENIKKQRKKLNFYYILILSVILEILFIFAFTKLYESRYFLVNYLLLFLLTIMTINLTLKYFHKKDMKIIFTFLIIIIIISYIFIPLYPTKIGCSQKQEKISNLNILKNYLGNSQLEMMSLFLGTSAINYDYEKDIIIKSCKEKECILIVADDYNSQSYFRELENNQNIKIYILNDFLKENSFSMKYNNVNVSVYALNQQYIENIEEDIDLNKKVFLLLKKGRFEQHNTQENINFVKNNFKLISKKEIEIGCRYNLEIDGIYLYEN